jgi:hypothetical protein
MFNIKVIFEIIVCHTFTFMIYYGLLKMYLNKKKKRLHIITSHQRDIQRYGRLSLGEVLLNLPKATMTAKLQ